MGKLDNLYKLNDKLREENLVIIDHLDNLGDELLCIADGFERIGEILTDIDEEFSKVTCITNSKDLKVLFLATGLLCVKWIIMGQVAPLDFDFKHDPNQRARLEHQDGDKIADEKRNKHKDYNDGKLKNNEDTYSEGGYRTVEQIILGSVPYDATGKFPEAFNPTPDGLGGGQKRVFTLGHDPILGWVFGTINILSFSSSLKSPFLKTYKVSEAGLKMDRLTTFSEELGHAINSIKEYDKRLPAAVFKQGMHLLSDKYTKKGLPIPLLTPEKAFELMQEGWNSVEAAEAIKKVLRKAGKNVAIIGIQFIISFLINQIIMAIHLLMYDEDKDGDIKLYQVRTRKILMTANCISSTSNVLFCAIFGAVTKNPVEAAKRLDVGGLIETIHRFVVDTKFVNEIKREYVKQAMRERILNTNNFEWWYVNEKGEISYE